MLTGACRARRATRRPWARHARAVHRAACMASACARLRAEEAEHRRARCGAVRRGGVGEGVHTSMVIAKSTTTTTSMSTVTESTAVVNEPGKGQCSVVKAQAQAQAQAQAPAGAQLIVSAPWASSSETSAMAEEGERATARHATMRATARRFSAVASLVSDSHGDANQTPHPTSK